MKSRLLPALLAFTVLSVSALRAQEDKSAPEGAPNAALTAVANKVRAKVEAGERTAAALAPELAEIDGHIAAASGDKEAAAGFLFLKAMIYTDLIEDMVKARELLLAITRDHPGTEVAPHAAEVLNSIDKAAKREAAIPELRPLLERVMAKVKTGPRTAAGLAAEIAEFDALVTKYAADPETAATAALMKALVYAEVLADTAKGREMFEAIIRKYPGTEAAGSAANTVARMPVSKDALLGKTAPELNFTWASREGLKTLSGLKGRVVVLDFWATWCGPCIRSFPQIREHVARFQGAPVTFLGVTSLQGRVSNLEREIIDTKDDPAREMALMRDFMKKYEMTWDVVFSEEPVFNPAYGIEGIPFLAIIAPDGTVRHAGLHPGDPDADVAGKIEAILKEFKLPLPASDASAGR